MTNSTFAAGVNDGTVSTMLKSFLQARDDEAEGP